MVSSLFDATALILRGAGYTERFVDDERCAGRYYFDGRAIIVEDQLVADVDRCLRGVAIKISGFGSKGDEVRR